MYTFNLLKNVLARIINYLQIELIFVSEEGLTIWRRLSCWLGYLTNVSFAGVLKY